MNDDNSFEQPTSSKGKSFEQLAKAFAHIKGWAIDVNRDNDPTYPMRTRVEGDSQGYNWERPIQQGHSDGVLQSNERPNLPAVFGTSTPASGLSGLLRRFAFRFSEGRYRHWLLLLLADRINMVEGLVQDVSSGHLPHCLDERGLNAELTHNRKAIVTRVAVGVVVVGALALLLKKKE